MLKTHITKYQTEVLAFSLKKYFQRWKKISEEYKYQMEDLKDKEGGDKQMKAFEIGLKKFNYDDKTDAGKDEEEETKKQINQKKKTYEAY